jgi:hypothetical protein
MKWAGKTGNAYTQKSRLNVMIVLFEGGRLWRYKLEWASPGEDPVLGSCQHSDEPSGSVKVESVNQSKNSASQRELLFPLKNIWMTDLLSGISGLLHFHFYLFLLRSLISHYFITKNYRVRLKPLFIVLTIDISGTICMCQDDWFRHGTCFLSRTQAFMFFIVCKYFLYKGHL